MSDEQVEKAVEAEKVMDDALASERGDEEVEKTVWPVWPYGLGDIKSLEGIEVTDDHLAEAMNATDCECLMHMDFAVSELSPGFRKYGGTLAKIATQFLEAREVIREEMTRLAHRNLLAVVTGNLGGRRVMNARLAVAEKEARDRQVAKKKAPVDKDPQGHNPDQD